MGQLRKTSWTAIALALVTSVLTTFGTPAQADPVTWPFAKGTVVDSGTGASLTGVVVEYRSIDDLTAYDVDTTNRRGSFQVHGLSGNEEFAVWVDGTAVGHESGYVGCGFVVVATWAEACSISAGAYTRDILLDPLP